MVKCVTKGCPKRLLLPVYSMTGMEIVHDVLQSMVNCNISTCS